MGKVIEWAVHVGQFSIDGGANRRGCSCRPNNRGGACMHSFLYFSASLPSFSISSNVYCILLLNDIVMLGVSNERANKNLKKVRKQM